MEQNSWKGKHKISRTRQNQHQLVTHRKLLSPYTAPRSALSRLCIYLVCVVLLTGRTYVVYRRVKWKVEANKGTVKKWTDAKDKKKKEPQTPKYNVRVFFCIEADWEQQLKIKSWKHKEERVVCSTFTKGRGKNPRKKTKENMVKKRFYRKS